MKCLTSRELLWFLEQVLYDLNMFTRCYFSMGNLVLEVQRTALKAKLLKLFQERLISLTAIFSIPSWEMVPLLLTLNYEQAIRALISSGAGSSSYAGFCADMSFLCQCKRVINSVLKSFKLFAGPSKLFLLVKSSSTFNVPLHFLPKRDFRYGKKVLSFTRQFLVF